jgi:hypothetical protein
MFSYRNFRERIPEINFDIEFITPDDTQNVLCILSSLAAIEIPEI